MRCVLHGNMLCYVVAFCILNLGKALTVPCFARHWECQFLSSYEMWRCLEIIWGR